MGSIPRSGHSGDLSLKCFQFKICLRTYGREELLGKTSIEKKRFLSDVKNDVLVRITERSKDDYDNDVSDTCDHNFGTFDDFGVKNDQKVSNNMKLMSKYKGKQVEKRVKKFGQGSPPPPFRAMPERKHFFYRRASLMFQEF